MRKIYADNSSIDPPYTEPDYAVHKYVRTSRDDGPYSRNLNHLWYRGRRVLLWDTPSSSGIIRAEARRDARRDQSHDGPGSGGGRRVLGARCSLAAQGASSGS